jgi:hypothetical protein
VACRPAGPFARPGGPTNERERQRWGREDREERGRDERERGESLLLRRRYARGLADGPGLVGATSLGAQCSPPQADTGCRSPPPGSPSQPLGRRQHEPASLFKLHWKAERVIITGDSPPGGHSPNSYSVSRGRHRRRHFVRLPGPPCSNLFEYRD